MDRQTSTRTRQHGFSLIELLVVLAILTLIMGVVFGEIDLLQKRYRNEETKLDLSQEAREVLTSFTRDLHSAGFPNRNMYSEGILMAPPESDFRNAVGLVRVTPTEVWFEGDIEGDGVVRSIRYTFVPGAGGACPCQLRRSEVNKVNATNPWDQATNYTTLISTVVNSGGTLTIAGTTTLSNGSTVANNVLYGAYRAAPVFRAYRADGTEAALPLTLQANPNEIRAIRTIRLTMNVLAGEPDMQTMQRPVMTLTSNGRIKN